MIVVPYSVNRKDSWDAFVERSKQGTFLLKRSFLDFYADSYFDCSLMVYRDAAPEDDSDGEGVDSDSLVAVLPANWDESDKTVYSHQGLAYGGLLIHQDATQDEVLMMMQKVLIYYVSYLGAETFVYKPAPYIYCRIPSGEDIYAIFHAGGQIEGRSVSACIDLTNKLTMRSLRIKMARKAIGLGCYIERVTYGDTEGIAEFCSIARGEDPMRLKTIMMRFPRNINIYVVRNSRSEMIFGVVAHETDHVAHLVTIASTEEALTSGAQELLFRHLCIERYQDKEYVDFGANYTGSSVCYDTYRVTLDSERISNMTSVRLRDDYPPHIPYVDLKRINQQYEPRMSRRLMNIISGGQYKLHTEVNDFEKTFANHLGVRHCIVCQTGSGALRLILSAYRHIYGWTHGDEIILSALAHPKTIMTIREVGLRPVMVDVDKQTLQPSTDKMLRAIGPRTRAVVCIHKYGKMEQMNALAAMAMKNNLLVIEDVKHAHGASRNGKYAGACGDAAAFDFNPSSNLGCIGNLGCVATNDDSLAEYVRERSTSASEADAAMLNIKLPNIESEIQSRRDVAKTYIERICNPLIKIPAHLSESECWSWNQFPVFLHQRQALQKYLSSNGVETRVPAQIVSSDMYPGAQRLCQNILLLPIHPVLTPQETERIITYINKYIPCE